MLNSFVCVPGRVFSRKTHRATERLLSFRVSSSTVPSPTTAHSHVGVPPGARGNRGVRRLLRNYSCVAPLSADDGSRILSSEVRGTSPWTGPSKPRTHPTPEAPVRPPITGGPYPPRLLFRGPRMFQWCRDRDSGPQVDRDSDSTPGTQEGDTGRKAGFRLLYEVHTLGSLELRTRSLSLALLPGNCDLQIQPQPHANKGTVRKNDIKRLKGPT